MRAGVPDVRPAGGPAWIVFWWGSVPLGARRFAAAELPPAADMLHALAARLIAEQIASRADEGLRIDRGDPVRTLDELADAAPPPADELSVVILSRGCADALWACLASLDAQIHRPGEIVVLDHSPSGAAGAVCRGRPALLHVLAPRPTVAAARAAALRVCSLPIVAFIDEEVIAEPNWTSEIVRAFAAPRAVDALAGLVLPTPVGDHDQEELDQALGGLDNPFARTRFEGDSRARAGRHGARSAGNIAVRRTALARIGASESTIQLGDSSEDAELWGRLRADGAACVYEPRAVVHRPEAARWATPSRRAGDWAAPPRRSGAPLT